jgi:phosphoserine phosphatase RsbU/P
MSNAKESAIESPPAGASEPETERASLLAQARALEPVLQALSDGVVVSDREGSFLAFNEAAGRILGLDPLEEPPASWARTFGLFLPDGVTPYPSRRLPLVCAVRGEVVHDVEICIRGPHRPEGAMLSVSAAPWKDPSGEQLGGITVLRDVTAHRTADGAVRMLSHAVEQTADAIYITDHDGIIQYVNPGFEHMTGYARAEVLGHTPGLLKSGLHDAAHYRGLWRALLAGQVFRGTMINRRKDGSVYYAEMTITPTRAPGGAITHFVAVGKDMTDRRTRQEQELELGLARAVQRRLFPAGPPQVPGFDIAGVAQPAAAMCGDYYDFVELPNGHFGLAVGDVSGHGMGPALVMAQTRAYLHAYVQLLPGVGDVLRALNRSLVADLEPGSFVTMLLAAVDPRTRSLTYANAGHPRGFVLTGRGEVRTTLDSSGTPLGVSLAWGVVDAEAVLLQPGDSVVFFTDGITESQAPDGSLLGTEGVLELLRPLVAGSAQQMVDGLTAGAREFARGCEQTDDLAVIVCKVEP